MKHVLCLGDVDNLQVAIQIPIREVLLQTRSLTKTGRIAESELGKCIEKLLEAEKHVILNCDIACDNKSINRLAAFITQFTSVVHGVRYRDPGVGRWLTKNFPDMPLQLSLENYSFSLKSILQWLKQSSNRINRVVLSNQIPILEIEKWRSAIGVDIEIQGLGQLEGFNSARPLLKSHKAHSVEIFEGTIQSNDRIQNKLTAIDNLHGTTLYFEEDLFLLDEMSTIESAGVNSIYLNLTEPQQYQLLLKTYPNDGWVTDLKSEWGMKITKGFFYGNKSDNQFKNLTNAVLQSKKYQQIGVVLELVKQKYTLVELRYNLDLPNILVFYTPNAGKIHFAIDTLKSLDESVHSKRVFAGYYKLPWIKNVVPSTAIHLQEYLST
jgi:U32 family peptidase